MSNEYDAELSPYKGVVGNEYRVVKQTLRDKTVRYSIQLQTCKINDTWVKLTDRTSFKLAMKAVEFLIGEIVETEEVVYDSTKSE